MTKEKMGFRTKLTAFLTHRRWALPIAIGGTSLFLISLFFIFSQFISPDKKGIDFTIEQIIQTVLIFLGAWIFVRFFNKIFSLFYQNTYRRSPPIGILTLIRWFFFIFALVATVVFVFDQSAANILTTGGLVGAGIAFALQGTIVDAFSGFILDVQNRFKIGDYIMLEGGIDGRIVDRTWRFVSILTSLDHCIYYIPNSKLITSVCKNVSQPRNVFIDNVQICLNFNVPVTRAERLLTGAMVSVDDVVKDAECTAYAHHPEAGGMIYNLRFGVHDYTNWRQIRHKVLEAISFALYKEDLGYSETIGEYALSRAVDLKFLEELSFEQVCQEVSLFAHLTLMEMAKLAEQSKRHYLKKGQILFLEGEKSDSLFIIAEGALEVFKTEKNNDEEVDDILAILSQGNFIGDKALLLGEPRSASVRAKTNCLLFEVTKEGLKAILQKRPELVEKLSSIMVERMHDTENKMLENEKKTDKKNALKNKLIKDIKAFFEIGEA